PPSCCRRVYSCWTNCLNVCTILSRRIAASSLSTATSSLKARKFAYLPLSMEGLYAIALCLSRGRDRDALSTVLSSISLTLIPQVSQFSLFSNVSLLDLINLL